MIKIADFKASKRIIVMSLFAFGALSPLCAKEKGVIMTVDGENIPSDEFIYLFNKNNQQQDEPQSLDEYLELFKVYRLKVAEAKKEGIDTTASFRRDIKQYRRELLEPYVTDTAFINSLVDIAAEREKTDVESSHIMIIRTHDEEKDKNNLALLDSIRGAILNGADFIELAKTYSQDKFSSDRGGYLGFNPAGTFPYAFETAVYETPEGEISEIVESHVGWHIVKSGARRHAMDFNRPQRPYEDIKADVLRKSSSPFDSRFFERRKNTVEKLKKKHKNVMFKTDGLTEEEIYQALMDEEEKFQYANNDEYRNLVDEYTNGSLLYEVSVINVWDKASADEEGLENYYQTHREDYKWETPHAKGILIQAVNDSVAGVIKEKIKGLEGDDIVKTVKQNFKKEATADRFNVPQGVNGMIDNIMFGGEPSSPKTRNFTAYFIVEGRIVPQPENMKDVKGLVVGDYQVQLEEEWIAALKDRHNLVVNNKELEKIRKNIK